VATVIPAHRLLEFGLLSYVLILVPGPNVLFVVSRSLQLGGCPASLRSSAASPASTCK